VLACFVGPGCLLYSAEAVPYITRKPTPFGVLAIVDDVYAGLDLPLHDLLDGFRQPRVESFCRRIRGEEFGNFPWPRQNPGVRHDDAIGTALHWLSPECDLSRVSLACGVRAGDV
jgi:hypothetical protein